VRPGGIAHAVSVQAATELVAVRPGHVEELRRRPLLLFGLGLIVLAISLAASVTFGSVSLPMSDTLAVLLHRVFGWPAVTWPQTTETIVIDLRLPRALAAMAVGAGLSVAGVTFQGLMRNPLADPYVLGTASGAALGAAIGVLVPVSGVLLGLGIVNVLAFGGAVVAVALVYQLAGGSRVGSTTSILLTGYAVGSLLAAALSVAMWFAGANLRQIFSYLLGSFATISWNQLVLGLPIIVGSIVVLGSRGRSLNALLLGDEQAHNLGLRVGRERRILLAAATLVTAASVALAGLIGFVGLVVPHVIRLVVGPNARLVLPLSVLYGASFLALADLVARIPGELPVGVITAIVGAPFFLFLLRRYRQGYEL
jgi:iron complex transport system permease protein